MQRCRDRFVGHFGGVAAAGVVLLLPGCHAAPGPNTVDAASATLRVGIGQVASAAGQGLRPVVQNLTLDLLATLTNEGRPRPSLAKEWVVSPDGLTLTITLRPGVKFHDGSPLTGAVVAKSLQSTLRNTMGPALEDVGDVSAPNDQQVVVRFTHPSPFILDSLEAPIQKPGAPTVGTGPFFVGDPAALTELRANENYYFGRPALDRVTVETFPSVRAAWAELLRGRLDMLYEVGLDALDSLETSTAVSVFTYTRHYQYALVFNIASDTLRSKEVRRALNTAVDRDGVVREALNGHGTVSNGPVWPFHFTFRQDFPKFEFDAGTAEKALSRHRGRGKGGKLQFTCLVPPDAVPERIALVLKRQLQAVGVEMKLEETSMDRIIAAFKERRFDAALVEAVSGPTLLRPYQLWHSQGAGNPGGFGSPALDAALDRIRHAASEADYLNAVAGFQQTIVDDPPAIFLAWIERARAVSTRFRVPASEPGRDILSTLYQWKPTDVGVRTH
jgi:peptide/nickel transport system substrate-binding protein